MRTLFFTLWVGLLPLVSLAARKPNVIFILTDNQGAWTLGCYGNKDIRTPHIDALAKGGIRFTRALSSNAVCSPTRATFLTGLIPSQHGVHSFLDPKFMMGSEAYNTLAEFTSLPEILKTNGYTCGLSGKWHLGANITPGKGFDFWVTKPEGSTREFYDQDVIENGQITRVSEYTTEYWTRRAIEFVESNREKPFFLYLAYNGPYSLGNLMLNESKNRHAAYYADKELHCFPRDEMHPWQHHNKTFHNDPRAMRRMACEVSGVDDGVGEVMAALRRLELEKDTLVVYSSDQGWMGGQNGIWGMGDHTRPIGAHELMMQIPLIFHQPGRIPSGKTCDHLVSNYDFLPSVLGHLGLSESLPREPKLPGRDFSPVLRGEPMLASDEAVYYEMETCRAVREDRWKLVLRHPSGPNELYDMQSDPRERFNLFGQPDAEVHARRMRGKLESFFNAYASPEYDLWKGGRSKAKRVSEN